ncbi:hypothetical protein GVN18_35545 [Pseudomonas sp. ODNR1LW]|nr:hypothetical protein [Pseudomonas sp. ODNR1LW]
MTDTPAKNDASTDAPYARKIEPDHGQTDHLEDKMKPGVSRKEALVDESLEETFPASDPISPKHIT